jgi:protein-S-isoprenylcysteine O-methyltransferase Ste14
MAARAGVLAVKLCIPPPILALIATLLMAALNRWLPLARCVPAPWYRLGLFPIAAGVVIVTIAFMSFRRVRTTVNPLDPSKATHLVTGGVFSISRNPMYLGLLLVLIGWALWLGTVGPWLTVPLFWLVITYGQILPEEQALTQPFGQRYAAYRRDVSRWLGRRAGASARRSASLPQ